jgi:cobalt/nickel transport system ATP-binding protein
LALDPDLIICDEPAASLDPAQSNELFCLLNKLNSDGKTILISTHDMDKAYEWADIVIVMNNGSVVAHGNADEVFYNGAFMQLSGNLCLPKVVDFCKKMNYPNFYPKNMNELLQKLNTEKKWV